MSTCCSMCLGNKSAYLMLNCIHIICAECNLKMLTIENDDYIMECFCGEKTPVNVTVRTNDIDSPQIVC